MFIEGYFYAHGTEQIDKGVYDKTLNRRIGMTKAFNKAYGDALFNFKTTGPTAFLYAGGPMSHVSDSANNKYNDKNVNVIIKQLAGDKVYRLASKYDNVEFVSINGDACASSMKLIYDAKLLLAAGDITDVIIYAENLVTPTQVIFFEQLGIDLLCGDGVSVMHLTAEKTPNSKAEISDAAWGWNCDATSMTVNTAGYERVLNKLDYDISTVNIIKPHGSGTTRNDLVEDAIIEKRFPGINVVKYKQTIGHTQGVSALIEIGMLLDSVDNCNAIIMASGLGAVYGACTLIK